MSLNTPVGYAKNPVVLGTNLPPRSSTNHSPINNLTTHPSNSRKGSFPFTNLPREIREQIVNLLSQYDTLALIRTSRSCAVVAEHRLYRCIVVDANYKRFDNEPEYSSTRLRQRRHPICSYISSPYNWRRFLRAPGCVHIQYLECVRLPLLLNVYDHDLHDDLVRFFKSASAIREITWLGTGFVPEYLRLIPNPDKLSALALRIDGRFPDLKFGNLERLEIRPAVWLGLAVKAVGRAPLTELAVARYSCYEPSLTHPPCYELATALPECTVISQVCLLNISSLLLLTLENILVLALDADLLVKTADLQRLRRVVLRGISVSGGDRIMNRERIIERRDRIDEGGVMGDIRRERIDAASQDLDPNSRNDLGLDSRGSSNFLGILVEHLTGVKELLLDVREAQTESVSDFLLSLDAPLCALDLTIRLNDTWEAEHGYFDTIGEGILRFHATIVKLAVEVREESPSTRVRTSGVDRLTMVPGGTGFYQHLGKLRKLRSLRINPGSQQATVAALIAELRLEKLDVFGSYAGGSPNLGLGMVHPTVHDEWFKVQHVAYYYWKACQLLRYVRIERWVFECVGGVNPRRGLDSWFDEEVKV